MAALLISELDVSNVLLSETPFSRSTARRGAGSFASEPLHAVFIKRMTALVPGMHSRVA